MPLIRHKSSKYRQDFFVLKKIPCRLIKMGHPILKESYTINMQIQIFSQQMVVELTPENSFHFFKLLSLQDRSAASQVYSCPK